MFAMTFIGLSCEIRTVCALKQNDNIELFLEKKNLLLLNAC